MFGQGLWCLVKACSDWSKVVMAFAKYCGVIWWIFLSIATFITTNISSFSNATVQSINMVLGFFIASYLI